MIARIQQLFTARSPAGDYLKTWPATPTVVVDSPSGRIAVETTEEFGEILEKHNAAVRSGAVAENDLTSSIQSLQQHIALLRGAAPPAHSEIITCLRRLWLFAGIKPLSTMVRPLFPSFPC